VTALIWPPARNARAATRFGGIPSASRGRARIGADREGAHRRGCICRREDEHRATPLMLASAAGDPAAIAALLDKGADVDAKESDRFQTPLIFAAANNRLDAVTLLVARGAIERGTKLTDLAALSRNGENRRSRPCGEAGDEKTNGAAEDPRAGRQSANTSSTSRWAWQRGMTRCSTRRGRATSRSPGRSSTRRERESAQGATTRRRLLWHGERPIRSRRHADRARGEPEPEIAENGRRPALRGGQSDVGPARRLSAAAGTSESETELLEFMKRCSTPAPIQPARQQEGLVLELQLRSVGRGRSRRDAVLARAVTAPTWMR